MAKAKKQTAEEPEWVGLTDELDWDDVGGRLLANIARGMRERKRSGGRVGLAPYTIKNYLIALKTALGRF